MPDANATGYFLDNEGQMSMVEYDTETGAFDCDICRQRGSENAGVALWSSSAMARANTRGRMALDVTTVSAADRPGNSGFIDYAGQRVFHWGSPSDASESEVDANARDAAEVVDEDTSPVLPPLRTLQAVIREAIAESRLIGTVLRWTVEGMTTSSDWRVTDLAAHDVVRMTLAEHSTDNGAANFPFDAYARDEWSILRKGDVAPTPNPTTVERVIPRTSQEAEPLAKLVHSLEGNGTPTALANALDTLVLMLPGGRAEQSGAELARRRSLCEVYESTVCGTLGWQARDGYGYGSRVRDFEAAMVEHEEDHAGQGMAETLIAFARRYERGGVVNEAILDSMEESLESHKRPDANLVLDALGLDTLDTRVPPVRNYEVAVEVTRHRTVVESTTVYVTVEAEDQDHAADLAVDMAEPDWGTDWYELDSEYDLSEVDREVGTIELADE